MCSLRSLQLLLTNSIICSQFIEFGGFHILLDSFRSFPKVLDDKTQV